MISQVSNENNEGDIDHNQNSILWEIQKDAQCCFKQKQKPKKQQLYGHLPLISQSTQVRQAKCAGHGWRSKNKLINDVFLWPDTETD